jgi:hypothetical protein
LASCSRSKNETRAFPSQHLKGGHETDAETDAGIWNLDLSRGSGWHFVCHDRVLSSESLCNEIVVRDLEKGGHGCLIVGKLGSHLESQLNQARI